MKEIKLTKGQIALVDDSDFEYLNQFKWHAIKRPNTYYAYRHRGIAMHREILGIKDSNVYADHEDRNGLNNQRNNLRYATPAQNSYNRPSYKNSSSRYIGVTWYEMFKKWGARIGNNGEYKFLGYFREEKDAALAYNKAAITLHGQFANINKIS